MQTLLAKALQMAQQTKVLLVLTQHILALHQMVLFLLIYMVAVLHWVLSQVAARQLHSCVVMEHG
jgi:hypothetical protein